MMQDENILIRALEPEDLEYLYKWENDMDLWDVSDTLTPFSHFTLKKYIENATPRMGKVRYENGYRIKDHKTEIEVADQLREQLGGKIVLLKEANTQGAKTPDYLWRGKQWELKSISTAKAADSAVRSAIKQIKSNPGGIILQCSNGIDENELKRTVDMRPIRKQDFDFDIIAINGSGELLFARRYKK